MEKGKVVTLYILFTCDIFLCVYGEMGNQLHPNRISKLQLDKSQSRNSKSREKRSLFIRYPREINRSRREKNKFGQALYFSGKREILKLRMKGKKKEIEIPRSQFTVELWVKPEGGQKDPTSIIEMIDICSRKSVESAWRIGIRTFEGNRKSRLFFSLKTERSLSSTFIYSITDYLPDHWTHITASYSGKTMKLFINGVQVAVGLDQQGDVFNHISFKCKEVRLGGSISERSFFRGTVDELRIWNASLSQSDVVRFLYDTRVHHQEMLFLRDSFTALKIWRKEHRRMPKLVPSDISQTSKIVSLRIPLCGKTICDDPRLIMSFVNNTNLQSRKTLRYRVVNIMDNDGSNPVVKQNRIRVQHIALMEAFSRYNISWELDIHNVLNTSLRNRIVMIGCAARRIGDGMCDEECQHPRTGNDGGDCDSFRLACDRKSIGDGRCDFECNRAYYLWDRGDCCLPGTNVYKTCYDPSSPHRGYISIEELRDIVNLDSSSHLNVFFATWIRGGLMGLSTFPWEKDIYSVQGGTVIEPDNFGVAGRTNNLVHELGHALGLWHVHHGVSEMQCDDQCVETYPSMLLGDLCSDTYPTPANSNCQDPDPSVGDCGGFVFENTPYSNYMSYADDACINHFTPQQVARMHCYLNHVYQPWWQSESRVPTPVPVSPRIVSAGSGSVSITWLPPLGEPDTNIGTVCNLCSDDGVLSQYAINATSSIPSSSDQWWRPEEAIGPPDAEQCQPSLRAWMPDINGCGRLQCFIEFHFAFPVIPNRLRLWVVWNAADGIEEVLLMLANGGTHKVGPIHAYCDMSITIRLDIEEKVKKIRVYTTSEFVGIDAIELTTNSDYTGCSSCTKRKYKITREPSFIADKPITTRTESYKDNEVVDGVTYKYRVQSVLGSKVSQMSPELLYMHAQSFCGDGMVNRQLEEECDDGNIAYDDGCDGDCKIEKHFHCEGNPSLCYIHEGDGVCQEFERASSIIDCGFHTPPGYDDQWVMSANANPLYQSPDCLVSLISGQPDRSLKCGNVFDTKTMWHPCMHTMEEGTFWVEVYFLKAVVATEVIVYLGSDGKTEINKTTKYMHIDLIDVNNKTSPLTPTKIPLDCLNNPIFVPVVKDLSTNFVLTKGLKIRFKAFNISIAGITLRSSKFLDPVRISSCEHGEMYSPYAGQCVNTSCSIPPCKHYVMKYGAARCSGHAEGDVCQVVCQHGYKLDGYINEVVCISGLWTSIIPVVCHPLDCGPPNIPHANVVCPDGTVVGASCVFKCELPAMLQGLSNGSRVTCEVNGLWSMPTEYCRIQCQPPSLTHAKLKGKSCKHGSQSVGKVCKFRCHKGYHVEDKSSTRRITKMECDESGRWNGNRCVRIKCPDISTSTEMYTCTDRQFVGSVCHSTCPENTQTVIQCSSDGHWNATFQICPHTSRRQCPLLSDVNDLIFSCPKHEVGSTCAVRCKSAELQPVRSGLGNRSRLQSVGTVMTNNTVLTLTCTEISTWFPDPAQLKCVAKCNHAFIGDGFCDSVNNRKLCLWDRGDCCESTVRGGVVKPFPETCKSECQCKDPDVIGNNGNRNKGLLEKRHKSKPV